MLQTVNNRRNYLYLLRPLYRHECITNQCFNQLSIINIYIIIFIMNSQQWIRNP